MPRPRKSDQQTRMVARTPWLSIGIAATLAFIETSTFSMFFSSTWPYMQQLDPHTTESFYAIVLSAFSIGYSVSAVVYGCWSNRCANVRRPTSIGIMIAICGHALYICTDYVEPQAAKWLILVGRLLVGIGEGEARRSERQNIFVTSWTHSRRILGHVCLLRSYAAMASAAQDRSRALAIVNGGLALGAACGPAFQVLFTPLGLEGFSVGSLVRINLYTAPAIAACLTNSIGLLVLMFVFNEHYAGIIEDAAANNETDSEVRTKERAKRRNVDAQFADRRLIACNRHLAAKIRFDRRLRLPRAHGRLQVCVLKSRNVGVISAAALYVCKSNSSA